MTEHETRSLIVSALLNSAIFSLRDNGRTDDFLRGAYDVSFSELEMDSLSAMELCIYLELNAGVSILPEQLPEVGSLEGLVSALANHVDH